MSDKIKGITIEINGDCTGLDKALKGVNKEIKDTQKELSEVEKLLKLDPKNTELLAQKQELLGKNIKTTKDKLNDLKEAQKQLDEKIKTGGDVDIKQYRNLQREIISTEQNLKSLRHSAMAEGMAQIESGAKNLAKAATAAAATIIGVGTATYAAANKIAATGDEIDKQSQKLGISAEAYQRWEQVCKHNGTTIDSLRSGMKNLDTAIASNNKAFKDLEINIEGASKEDVFERTILALQKMEDPIKRNQAAIKIFGSKSVQEMGALLNCTNEETEAMLQHANVVSNDNVKAAVAFKDAQQDLTNTVEVLGNELLAGLLPSITQIMDKLQEFISSHKEDIQNFCQWLLDNMDTVVILISSVSAAFIGWNVSNIVMGAVKAFKAYQAATEGASAAQWLLNVAMNANPIGIVIVAVTALVAGLVLLYKKCTPFREFVDNVVSWCKEKIPKAFTAVVDFFKKTWTKITDTISNIHTVISKLPQKMLEVGENIIKGLWDGIQNKIKWLKEKVSGTVDTIKGWITGKKGFDEHSPSRWAKQVGEFVMQGLAEGITEDMSVSAATEKKLENLKNFITSNMTSIQEEIKQKQDSFKDSLIGDRSLFFADTYTINGKTTKNIRFNNFSDETAVLKEYGEMLAYTESRILDLVKDNDFTSDFMQLIRNMGMTDGSDYMRALQKADDSTILTAVNGYQNYIKTAETIANETYKRECNNLNDEFLDAVESGIPDIVDTFSQGGIDSADAFGASFLERINSIMQQIQDRMSNISSSMNKAGQMLSVQGGLVTNTSNSYDNRSTNITVNNNGVSGSSPYATRVKFNRLLSGIELWGRT